MGKIARKLEIDFLSENPNGIRVVKNVSFPFTAYIIPRNCMSEVSDVNLDGIGIYFLFNENRNQVYRANGQRERPNSNTSSEKRFLVYRDVVLG